MNSDNLKGKIIKLVLVVGLLATAYMALQFFLKATVTIEASEQASVEVVDVKGANKRVWSDSGKTSYKVRLKKGAYTVKATDGSAAFKQMVDLGYREKTTVKSDLQPLKQTVMASPEASRSVGMYNNQFLFLRSSSPTITNLKGEIVYENYEEPIHSVLFADDGSSYLQISKQGSVRLTSDNITRTVLSEEFDSDDNEENTPEYSPIVSVSYDAPLKSYCILRANGEVFSAKNDFSFSKLLSTKYKANYIDCDSGKVAYAYLNAVADGEVELKKTTAITIVDGNNTYDLKATSVTALRLLENGNKLLYADEGIVYYYDLGTKKSLRTIDVSTTNTNSLFVQGDTVIVFDKDELWQLLPSEQKAWRLSSGKPFSAVRAAILLSGGDLAFSIDRGNFGTGIFMTSSDPKVSALASSLDDLLPVETTNYQAWYGFDGNRFNVFVDLLGEVPATEVTEAAAKAATEDFISKLPQDPNLVSIIRL